LKYTAKELEQLGFERTEVTKEEWGGDDDFTYYNFETKTAHPLITTAVNLGDEEIFEVYFFNVEEEKPLGKTFLKQYIKFAK